MASDFQVTVGADLSAYNKSLKQAETTAASTSTNITKSLAKAAKASAEMGGAVSKSSNQAGIALINLNRVVQDAPFGWIGVQNNIDPVVQSFKNIVAETGSVGAAFRALGSSLMGPGGLFFAFNIVTSAITFYTQWKQRATAAAKESKKATDDETNSAAEQISKLDALYGATQNLALPQSQRVAAVKELQKEYPAYFKNMSQEAILAGKAASAYESLTQSIINSAIVKAGEAQLTEALKPLIEIITEQEKLQVQIDKQNEEAQKKNPSKVTTFGSNTPGFTSPVISGAQNKVVQQWVDDETTAAKKLGIDGVQSIDAYKNRLTTKIKETRSAVQQLIQSFGINSLIDPDKDKADKQAKAKTLLEQYEEQLKQLQDQEAKWIDKGNTADWFNLTARERNINVLILLIDKLKAAQEGVNAPTPRGTDVGTFNFLGSSTATSATNKDIGGMMAWQKAAQAQLDLKKNSKSANDELTKQEKVVNAVSWAFGNGLTDAFQSALSGTQSFVSAMAQFLGDLITRLIAAAAAAAVLAVILSAVGLGPGLAGAATASGSFKSLFGAFSGVQLAEGGITTGPTRALIGEGREKEAVMPLSKLQSLINTSGSGWQNGAIVGVLRGPNQLLQIRRAEQQKSRIG